MKTFHELFAQGVKFMVMKVDEVAVDGRLQCGVLLCNTINIMLVINMEDSKTPVTSNK